MPILRRAARSGSVVRQFWLRPASAIAPNTCPARAAQSSFAGHAQASQGFDVGDIQPLFCCFRSRGYMQTEGAGMARSRGAVAQALPPAAPPGPARRADRFSRCCGRWSRPATAPMRPGSSPMQSCCTSSLAADWRRCAGRQAVAGLLPDVCFSQLAEDESPGSSLTSAPLRVGGKQC